MKQEKTEKKNTGVNTEDLKISFEDVKIIKKVKIKCEERVLRCEDGEAETPDMTKLFFVS